MGNPLDAIGDAFDAGRNFAGSATEQGGRLFDAAIESAKKMSPADAGHLALDGAGMIPVVGEVADVANGIWYAVEGNAADAALSLGSAIPFAGNAVTAAKWGKRAVDAADTVADVARNADNAADAARAAGNAADAGTPVTRADGPDGPRNQADDVNARGLNLTTVRRTQGQNSMEWQVDDQGRFASGRATLNEDFAGRKTRGSDEVRAQREAASRGVEGDQGGHMFAHRFVKDQGSINLVPQNGDLNNRAWGQMEQEWGDWIQSGRRIDVEIEALPAGMDRPESFRINYDVVDPETGRVVYTKSQRFENEAGQTFDRVSGRDIREWD